MEASEVKFGGRYLLAPSKFLGRPRSIAVTVVERSQRPDFFRVRTSDGDLLTESVHCTDLAALSTGAP